MKICNLKIRIARKAAAFVIAACGFLSTSFVYSFEDIALGDPSFEAYVVPAPWATHTPTSIAQPAPGSMILTARRVATTAKMMGLAIGFITLPMHQVFVRLPGPGDQAMHGIGYYNGQEAADAVFEANKTYTFSVWAQGDDDADGSSSRVWLYIYDGANPFTEASSLNFARYAPDTGDFVNRDPAWTDAQSMAGWTQISISHTVLPGAPEIGHPIGVAFWVAGDGAVDDASLTATVEGVVTVAPDSVTPTRGINVGGDVASLAESDNVDYSMQRSVNRYSIAHGICGPGRQPHRDPLEF